MIMMYLLFLLSLIVCRFFSGYDSRFQNGKYIIINSPKLRMLLVDEMSFFERKKRLKKDINKMTISGLLISFLRRFFLSKKDISSTNNILNLGLLMIIYLPF